MSGGGGGGEKTEQPTPKKIRDAREKGQVAKSKDFTQTLLILALFGYMLGNADEIVRSLAQLILMPISVIEMDFAAAANVLVTEMLKDATLILLPFLLLVLVIGIFAETIQTGILFAFEAIKPSAKKLDVVTNLKNIFSSKNIVEFIKSVVKVVFLSILLYVILKDALPIMMSIPPAGLGGVGQVVGQLLKIMMINIAVAYGIISFADLIWQRYKHNKDLMMSIQEIKQEYKQSEGDPQIKHQRKHIHQEMLMHGAAEKTRDASVVVTNPTHLAIAIVYKEGETPLPIVLAKGEGALAEQMVKVAHEEGIPVLQNIPLAHDLMNYAELDQYIPSELIEPVAEVLRLVKRLKNEESTR